MESVLTCYGKKYSTPSCYGRFIVLLIRTFIKEPSPVQVIVAYGITSRYLGTEGFYTFKRIRNYLVRSLFQLIFVTTKAQVTRSCSVRVF
jgi:hypothetical protein